MRSFRFKLFMTLILICVSTYFFAQITQTVRGTVVDIDTKSPLYAVNVSIDNGDPALKTATDEKGTFKIKKVPLGRVNIHFSVMTHKYLILKDIEINSGKEVVLTVEMQETTKDLDEITVTSKKTGAATNEMSLISSREFSVQETEKYAGSRGEPARMARNYAGVTSSDDSRNDIIIRGNTPLGVLWRMDGVNIPNPNHFSIPGTGGGPVTILNNKFLANSDFFTGAFPAEYANGIAGAFDLKMRNGNNEKYEGSAQVGILGTELMLEGPISKNKGSSFMAMYRYSTISIFHKLGIDIGTNASPKYQDGAFRFNFPLKNGGTIAFFGIGGLSEAPIIKSIEKDTNETELYGSIDRDQYFTSNMGVTGISYAKPINSTTYMKMVVSVSDQIIKAHHDKVLRHIENGQFKLDSLIPILDYKFRDKKYSAYFTMNKKFSKHFHMRYGLNYDLYDSKYLDSVRVVYLKTDNVTLDSITDWRKRWDSKAMNSMIQPYLEFRYLPNDKLTLSLGATALWFTISDKAISPFEPRLGLSYNIDKKQSLNIGIGLHSQILAPYLYYYDKNEDEPYKTTLSPYNLDLKLMKSLHFIAGYQRYLGENIKFKLETYYQYLFDLPVETKKSSYCLINSGSGFSRFFPDALVSTGVGRNYGVDVTIEKNFSHGYFFMASGSLFDSKYRGSDDTLRNTSFNGKYGANILFGKEFKLGKRRSLNVGGNLTVTGGQRYGIVDDTKSQKEQEIVYLDAKYNEFQFHDYFRADIKISYKANYLRLMHEISIDVVNLLNTKNDLRYTYSPGRSNPIVIEPQIGRLPIFYYRINF